MAEDPKSRKRKASSGILRAVLIVLISLVVGLNIYQWNARRLVGNSFPMPLGFGMAVVLSGSMEPTLHVNDLVIVRSAETYAVGDVIVFQQGGDLIIHRIISIDAAAEKLQTQGDANNSADAPIAFTQVKGKESFHIPYVGIMIRALKTPLGIITVIAFALLLMRSSWKKEKESGDEELEAIKAEIRRLKEEEAAQAARENQTLPKPEEDPIDIPLK